MLEKRHTWTHATTKAIVYVVALTKIALSSTQMGFQVIAKEAFRLEGFDIIISCAIPGEVICAGQQQGVLRYGVSLVYKLIGRKVWK